MAYIVAIPNIHYRNSIILLSNTQLLLWVY